MSAISARMIATDAAFASVKTFYNSRYGERRLVPGICDFTFGNPHEMPLEGIVTAIRERAIPHDKNWFAYKTSEQNSQATIAERLSQELDLTFEPEDIALTAGAFAAIMVAFRLVVDAGDADRPLCARSRRSLANKAFLDLYDVRKRASAAIAVKKCVLGGGDDCGEFRYETNRRVSI